MSKRIRVVLVDDHEMVRQTWRMVLERHAQIEVIAECSAGAEALNCAEKENPDVMLLDINMHPMSGFELAEKLHQSFPHIKLIGVSIHNQPLYARNMLKQGARGYVTKNASAAEMLEAILKVYEGEIYICREVAEKMETTSGE